MSTPKMITPLKRLAVLIFAGTMASSCAVTGSGAAAGIHPAVPLIIGGAIIGNALSHFGRHRGGGHGARSRGRGHGGHGRGWRRGGRGWDHGGRHHHH